MSREKPPVRLAQVRNNRRVEKVKPATAPGPRREGQRASAGKEGPRTQRRGGRAEKPDEGDWVYGINPVNEALTALGDNRSGCELLVREGPLNPRVAELKTSAARQGLRVREVAKDKLDALTGGGNHQGVALRTNPFEYTDELDILASCKGLEHATLLVLDGVQDPHNFGALLRSAAAFGIKGVIIPRDRAAQVTPTVMRIAAGAAFHMPIARVTNLARFLDLAKEAGFWLYGAAADGAVSLPKVQMKGHIALLMGAEDKGLRRLSRERCDVLVSIPIESTTESLNVAVAGGILMYASVQREVAAEEE
ncbi:MAG: 23S rRNA (guanosine(2251)-2'-O)-methyltransferase RlmB [Deltaproteobacteria bacterium CG_4_9_14_3_um_filter_63_12]|nr:MAG: 23S rRNA (guanosine(2251)-2'-O)-methyltransferase RlmB [Deltaproteobacteria bacterium CG_4_9_14_3_um_filter_63_12]